MDRLVELHLHALLLELLWIVPLSVGVISVGYAWYSSRRREAIATVMACFILSVFVLTLGALGTWRSGLELWILLGVSGDISADLLYEGWRHSWRPLIVSGASTVGLLGIATTAKLRSPVVPTERKATEAAVWMAVPAVIVISIVFTGFVLEALIDAAAVDYRLFPFIAFVMGAYYLLAIAGIPYMIIWGTFLYKWRRRAEKRGKARILTVLFFVLALLTLIFAALFFVSAWKGINPFLPWI